MQPTLLCMGMNPNQLMRVSFGAAALGVRVKAVGESDWGQTVGALCGLEPMNPSPQKASVDEAMIVMAFFDDALTDRMRLNVCWNCFGRGEGVLSILLEKNAEFRKKIHYKLTRAGNLKCKFPEVS